MTEDQHQAAYQAILQWMRDPSQPMPALPVPIAQWSTPEKRGLLEAIERLPA